MAPRGFDLDAVTAQYAIVSVIALERLGLHDRRVVLRFADRREEIVAG